MALLSGLLTPNGLAGLAYPLRVLGQFGQADIDLQQTISEMVPLLETRGSLALTLILFKVSLAWGLLWTVANWSRVSKFRVALWILAAGAAWQGQRNLGLYAVAFLLLHGASDTAGLPPWQRLTARMPARLRGPSAILGVALGIAAVTCAVAAFWVAALANDTFYLREGVARRWGAGVTPANYPLAAAAALPAGSDLRVANTVDAASTIVASRNGHVAIDGRTEAYPAAAWRDYGEFKAGGEVAQRRLRTWRTGAVCLAHRNTAAHAVLRTLLEDPAWVLVSADPAGILLRPRAAVPDLDADEAIARGVEELRTRFAAAPAGRDARLADDAAAFAALLQLVGDTPIAEEFLLAALDHCPDHPSALHNLGNILLARNEFGAALRRFESAARLNRNAAPPLVNAGNCLYQLGRITDAAEAFEDAVGRDPRNFEGWANLAEVRRRLGDRDGAGAAYGKALELRPGDRRLRQRSMTL